MLAGLAFWGMDWFNLIGYLPFFLVSFWVFDLPSLQQKMKVVGTILAFDVVCLVVFAGILGWI